MPLDYQSALLYTLSIGARARLADITTHIRKSTADTVQSGPFAKMTLPVQHPLYNGAIDCSKLLGCYEAELHNSIEKAIQRKPDIVINIGSAEGFYAVGLAKRLPNATIYAFESDSELREICSFAADQNGVKDRIQHRGTCTSNDLATLLTSSKKALIFMDCEGDELHLINNDIIHKIASCDIIVECHDFVDRTITPLLSELLKCHHDVERLQEGSRNPSAYPQLRSLSSFERWLTMCEFRPEVMTWLAGWSKKAI